MTEPLAPLRSGFAMLVYQTSRHWRRSLNRRLQPFGLSEATWRPLLYLSRNGAPMRQKELAAALGLDNSSVVRTLDALQAAGLVERREDQDDRRARALVLTPAGGAIVQQVEQVATAMRAETLAGLSDGELEAATHVLNHVNRQLAAEAEEQEP